VAPTYTATQSGAVVTVGSGPVVVDVYEDYLCPICERFEERYGSDLTAALNANQITVRYHSIAILDSRTTPKGYSTRAANAALCSVQAGVFPAYHAKLFASQPAEGSAGLTDAELVAFGTELKAQGDFAGCVNGATNASAVGAETDKATTTPALQTDGQFGTPTVALAGKKVDINNTSWLKDAIAAG
jgi:protein-disulfide isomerase